MRKRNTCRHPLQLSPSAQVNSPGTSAARAVTILAVVAGAIALVASIAPAISRHGPAPIGDSANLLGTDSVSAAALVVVSPALLADHTNRLYDQSAILCEALRGNGGNVHSILQSVTPARLLYYSRSTILSSGHWLHAVVFPRPFRVAELSASTKAALNPQHSVISDTSSLPAVSLYNSGASTLSWSAM